MSVCVRACLSGVFLSLKETRRAGPVFNIETVAAFSRRVSVCFPKCVDLRIEHVLNFKILRMFLTNQKSHHEKPSLLFIDYCIMYVCVRQCVEHFIVYGKDCEQVLNMK